MAKKTSFEEADKQQKTLMDLMNESSDDQQEAVVELDAQEPVSQDGSVTSSDADGDEGTEARTVSPWVSKLRESGYDISDDIPEEDLQLSVLERLRMQRELERQIEQERREREKLARELEEAKRYYAQPPAQQPPVDEQKPQPVSRWTPIEEIDQELLKYVEQDPNTGLWRSREEYETLGGREAAESVNKYYRLVRQRSQALVKDPVGVLWENGLKDQVDKMVEERAQRLLDEKLKSYDSKLRSSSSAAYERRAQEETKKQRMEQFWNEHGTKFVKTSTSGEPLLDLNGNYVLTDFGRQFQEEAAYIKQTLGVQDEEQVHWAAWRNLQRIAPKDPVSPVAPPAAQAVPQVPAQPAPQPVVTGEQKKRRFVERRSATTPSVPADRSGYQEVAKEKPTFTGRLSLRDLVEEEEALS